MGNLDGEFSHGVNDATKTFDLSEYRSIQAETEVRSHTFTSTTADAPVRVLIQPSQTVRVRITAESDARVSYNLYKNTDSTAGAAMAGDNFNLAANKKPDLATITHSPTVTSTGTQIVDTETSGNTGVGLANTGGTAASIGEGAPGWVVDSSIPLLAEFVPDSTGYIAVKVAVERHPYTTDNS